MEVDYIDGTWVYLEFQSRIGCSNFKQSGVKKQVFKELRPVIKSFVDKYRMVWGKIDGLSLSGHSMYLIKIKIK